MNGTTVGIAGLGLIGGSIALRARAAGARIVGFDCDPAAVAAARARNALDESVPDLATLAARAATLVVALPVDAVGPALRLLAQSPGPQLVIDVASVKGPLVGAGADVTNYVGTHPMAGRERGGIAAADPALFVGATWAYTPCSDAALTLRVRAFISAMDARPLEIDAAAHDAIVALTSHLPQALSVTLAAQLAAAIDADARVTELCGPGMMSMLRIARSPAATWSPIFAANGTALVRYLRSTANALLAAAEALDQGDPRPLISYFEPARGAVAALEKRYPIGERP